MTSLKSKPYLGWLICCGCISQQPPVSKTLTRIPSALERKLKKKLKQASIRAGRAAVKQGTQAHLTSKLLSGAGLPPSVSNAIDREVNKRVNKAVGNGAYGRGAYGRGAYGEDAPQVNSLFVESMARRPELSHVADETGRITVTRREYVMRVIAPTDPGSFSNTQFAINPGLRGVFAWLSQIAANYDEYSLQHLVFNYKPVISKASQSGSMGSVLLAANYNAGAPKFESFREMAEYMGAMEMRICDEGWFGVECDHRKHGSQPIEYIRTGAVPAGQDVKTYDLGTFQLATSDVDAVSYPAGTLLGHLYVEYKVVLGKPKLFSALGKNILQDRFRSTTGMSAVSPTADAIGATSNTLGGSLDDAGSYTLPANFTGTILVKYYWHGNSIDVADNLGINPGANITIVSQMRGDGTSNQENTYTAANQAFYVCILNVVPPDAGSTSTFTVGVAAATSITSMALIVTMITPDLDW